MQQKHEPETFVD